jgi:hypothetical protein
VPCTLPRPSLPHLPRCVHTRRDLGLHHVRANLDKYPAVIHKIVACVLERIERERYVWFCCLCVTPQHTHTPLRPRCLDADACPPPSLSLGDSHGELMDRSLLSSVCRMLVALGLYPVFEMAFLEHSELFYQAEGSRRAVSDDVRGDGDSECVYLHVSISCSRVV